MAVTVDQSRLILNSFAAIFQNNLVSRELVTWKKFDNEMNDRNGMTVVEQVTPNYIVTQTVDGVVDLTTGVQDTVYGSEQYKLNRTFGASMGWGDWNKIRDIGSARENEALKSAALALATQIDAYILGFAALASNNWTGDHLLPISDFDDVANGFTRLKEEGVEDPNLRAVLPYGDKQALASTIIYGGYGGQSTLASPGPVGNAALSGMGDGVYREGFTGKIADTPVLFTQQLPTFTSGTHTATSAVGAANQNVNYKAVAISPAPGQYLTQTLSITGVGANGTIKDGEVFTIAGVFAYDNRLQAPIPRLQQFRVIGDTTADGAGAATIRIFPALVVPGAGNIGDGAVNRANATVSAAPAAAAVITWKMGPSVSVKPRFLMNKDAVIVNTADLPTPYEGTASRVQLTKLPLSVRMWKDSVFATADHRIRFDVALTANIVDRRRLVRIGG
jgi:hypothetical protein